jgi:hypothetical protein
MCHQPFQIQYPATDAGDCWRPGIAISVDEFQVDLFTKSEMYVINNCKEQTVPQQEIGA